MSAVVYNAAKFCIDPIPSKYRDSIASIHTNIDIFFYTEKQPVTINQK